MLSLPLSSPPPQLLAKRYRLYLLHYLHTMSSGKYLFAVYSHDEGVSPYVNVRYSGYGTV